MVIRNRFAPWLAVAAALVTTAAGAPKAMAADLFWSANGIAQGGAGTWDTTNTRWGAVAAGPYGTIWDNANNDTAIFGSTGGAVSLGTNITAGGLTFSTNSYSISTGNTLTLAGASTPIINVVTSGHTATINSIIAGTVGLRKNGAGHLVLANASNSYTGETQINGGTLQANSAAALGGSSVIRFTGSGLLRTAHSAYPTFTQGVAIDVGVTGRLDALNQFHNMTFSGQVSGSGTLWATSQDNGAGNVTLSNTGNTHTGIVRIGSATKNGGLTASSMADGAGAVELGATTGVGGLTFQNTIASQIFSTRQVTLSGTTGGGAITNNGATANIVSFAQDLAVTGVGNKSLTLAGSNIGLNTFSGAIADGVGSSISIIKSGAGRWVLSNTANSYTGGTTVSAGTLETGASSVLAAGPVTVTGGSLQLGAFDHTTGVLTQTAGTISGSGALSAKRFLLSGGTINPVLAGSGDLYKSGTGTVTLNVANSYSGGTTVAGGTLTMGASGTLGANTVGNSITIANDGVLRLSAAANSGSDQGITLASSSNTGAPVLSGGAGPVGRLSVLALGFNGLPTGAISQANTLGGVIAINAVAGYNTDLSSALTGTNLFLGAIGTSTFTGAAGTVVAGNDSLYRLGGGGGQVTFSTTNLFTGGDGVQVGSTFVNGGGTVVISAAQDYTGATTVNAGTLTLSGANGTATGSSGFTLNGGRLFLDSVGVGNNNANRIGNVNVSLRNGGELSLNGNAAGTTEAFGNLAIGSGYSTATATAVTANSTLAGTGFSRTSNGVALFRGTALGQNAAVMGQVTLSDTSGLSFVGASTLNNAANGDATKDVRIIPYLIGATTGTGTGDTFVTYDDTLGFRVLNTTNQFNTTTATAGTNVRLAAAQTGIATNSINSLIIANTGSSTIADGATLTVASGAVLFNAAGTIAPAGTTGILDFGSAEGIVTTVANGVISAQITGSGGLTKSGTGQLTLSNTNNTYTGGTVLNGGVLATSVNGNLGGSGGITVNANTTWNMGGASAVSYARDLTINEGATLTLASGNAGKTVTGVLSGNGTLFVNHSTDFIFNNAANTFTGAIVSQTAGSTGYGLGFASIGDTAGAGLINLVGNTGTFRWLSASGSTTTLANRQFSISTPGQATISALGTTAASNLVINQNLLISGEAGARSLRLAGTNTGNNTFAGQITDEGFSVVSLNKADAGRWILSNANTFSGATLVSAGILELTNSLALQNSPLDATNSVTGAAAAGLRTTVTTLTIGGLNGTKNLSTLFTTTTGGYGGVTALTLNPVADVTTSYSGVIANGAAGMSLTKTGAGTQILSGVNTYTGATAVNAGTLLVNGSTAAASLVTVGINGNLGGTGTINGATTILGAHTPGNSPGIQTFASDLSYSGGNSTVEWELVQNTTTNQPNPNAIFDQIVVGGNLDFADPTALNLVFNVGSTVDWTNVFWDTDQSWVLYDVTGTISNIGNLSINVQDWADGQLTPNLFNSARPGNYFTVTTTGAGPGQDVLLNYIAVPEPTTMAILGAGVTLLGVHVARRRRAGRLVKAVR